MNIKKSLIWFAVIFLLQGCSETTNQETRITSKENTQSTSSAFAAIAIPDQYGAKISQDILDQGGNAVDAAIAAGFSLAVTFIDAGNIGGGGFMTIKMGNEIAFLDYREKAPLKAHRATILDQNGNVLRPCILWNDTRSFEEASYLDSKAIFRDLTGNIVFEPAISLAEEGFLPAKILVDDIYNSLNWFGDKTNFPAYFSSIKVDEKFKQPELAQTLRRIAKFGADDFYRGETADLIVKQMASSNGLITKIDLEKYEAKWREPLRAKWREYEIISSPPPSSGGFAVIQLLKMKDYLAHLFKGVGHNTPQYIHLVAEMEKRVFADRAEYLGDPDFFDTNITTLISDNYIASRALEVNPDSISSLEGVSPGIESPNTTHYSIVDQWGNAVSNTYTINWNYGSGVVVEGAGFLLNNEMDDFSAKPGVPNVYGLVGSKANAIAPEKRMLSSMTPTIVEKNGVEMVLGTPGGSTIFTSVFQVITNIIDFKMSPYEAVKATRFHHQLLPEDEITYNGYTINNPLPKEVIAALGDYGYKTIPHSYDFGDVQVIMKDNESWIAASDPRDRGDSRVFEVSVTAQ